PREAIYPGFWALSRPAGEECRWGVAVQRKDRRSRNRRRKALISWPFWRDNDHHQCFVFKPVSADTDSSRVLQGGHIMTANAPKIYDIAVEDVEYLRHGDSPLLARLFMPRGQGPFPLIVELHGGAWNLGDRLQDTDLNTALAQSGVVVAALDFRMPPVASYPASLVDINYAIRWLKTRATAWGRRPRLVGAFGLSNCRHKT